jgi:hypothetical protein
MDEHAQSVGPQHLGLFHRRHERQRPQPIEDARHGFGVIDAERLDLADGARQLGIPARIDPAGARVESRQRGVDARELRGFDVLAQRIEEPRGEDQCERDAYRCQDAAAARARRGPAA